MSIFQPLAQIIVRARAALNPHELGDEQSVRNLIIPQLEIVTKAYNRADKSVVGNWSEMTIEFYLGLDNPDRELHFERWFVSVLRKPSLQKEQLAILCRSVYLHLRLLPFQRYKVGTLHSPRVRFVILKGAPSAPLPGHKDIISLLDVDQPEGAFRVRVEYLLSLDELDSPSAAAEIPRARSVSANFGAGRAGAYRVQREASLQDRAGSVERLHDSEADVFDPARRLANPIMIPQAGRLPARMPGGSVPAAQTSPLAARATRDAPPREAQRTLRTSTTRMHDDFQPGSLPAHLMLHTQTPPSRSSSLQSDSLPFTSPASPPMVRREVPAEKMPSVFSASPDAVDTLSMASDHLAEHYQSNASLHDVSSRTDPSHGEELPFAIEVEAAPDLDTFVRQLDRAPRSLFSNRVSDLATSMVGIEHDLRMSRDEISFFSQSLRQ
eukprot:m.52774 g.52774  ORF g.52774 m.52774 type:complete len:439 (+) comp6407_c0_seq2:90-1406(+)